MPHTRSTNPVNTSASRTFWLRQLHQWHWISSAIALIAMLAFSITGITLNHSTQIEAHPDITKKTAELPPALLQELKNTPAAAQKALPAQVGNWIEQSLSIRLGSTVAEWSPEELYLSLPRPGGDAWLRITLDDGAIEYEKTERGWIAYFNDLHKGRNTGVAWSWFIDIFAVACLLFCITGLLLLKMHAAQRALTWPMVGLGLLMPLILALIFIH